MTMAKMLLPALVGLALAGCGGGSKEPPEAAPSKDIGAQAADVSSDTNALRAANGAAGEVVRAAGDCEQVKAALPEANRSLDEIEKSVRTAAGKATFLAVRKRVNDIAQMCP
jgi:outer membrane murein-binding lipoprotein Lpp